MDISAPAETTAHAIGTCPNCGTVLAATIGHRTCTCGARVKLTWVRGTYSAAEPCDDRCQYAVGPTCTCACGGENHAYGYIHLNLLPQWVTARNAARNTARSARVRDKATQARRTRAQQVEALTTAHPLLAWLTYPQAIGDNDFLHSIGNQLSENGYLSPRQIEAAERSITAATNRATAVAAREASRKSLTAAGVVAPTGRVTITGELVHVRADETYYGGVEQTVWKGRIRTAEGWTVWMTLGNPITDAWHNERNAMTAAQRDTWTMRGLCGRSITCTVTLEAGADGDPLHRFGKRPTNVTLHPKAP